MCSSQPLPASRARGGATAPSPKTSLSTAVCQLVISTNWPVAATVPTTRREPGPSASLGAAGERARCPPGPHRPGARRQLCLRRVGPALAFDSIFPADSTSTGTVAGLVPLPLPQQPFPSARSQADTCAQRSTPHVARYPRCRLGHRQAGSLSAAASATVCGARAVGRLTPRDTLYFVVPLTANKPGNTQSLSQPSPAP